MKTWDKKSSVRNRRFGVWRSQTPKRKRRSFLQDKKISFLLCILYTVIFICTIVLQWISIQNPARRLAVNISTLLLALTAAAIIRLLVRNGDSPDEHPARKNGEENRTQEMPLPSKEVYLHFAGQCQLTKRETEIGYLVLHGYSNLQLAEELYISETTVKKHLTHIYQKTGTCGRKEFRQALCSLPESGPPG